MVNGLDVDGAVQSYFNSSMSQEMVYTTSGASADVAGGGIRLNMIPRDGGNTLKWQPVPRLSGPELPERQRDRRPDRSRPADQRRHRQAVQRRRRRSAARSRRTRSGSSRRPATSCSTLCRRTPSTASPARRRRPRRRCRHRTQAWTRRASAASRRGHLADEPEEQAGGLQRSPAEEPRLRDDRRLRSDDRRHRLELADLHDRFGEVLFDGEQPDLLRGRLLDQLRALQHAVPAWPRDERRSRRSGTPIINKNDSGARHAVGRRHDNQGMYPDRFAAAGPCRTSPARTTSRSACRTPGAATASSAAPTATCAPYSSTACAPR